MKFYGDIPQNHLETIEDLEKLEAWFNEHGAQITKLAAAKGFVCMAHDWYLMDMEEEGERLLKRAEKECPGYFKAPIFIHVAKHEDFATIVANLMHTMALEKMISLGFEYEY